jgi:hypothetical protein
LAVGWPSAMPSAEADRRVEWRTACRLAQGCHANDIGRTDGRTMAAGASVTWTHFSVLFEVTWDKTVRIRTDATMCPRGRARVCADIGASARTRPCVRADIGPSARTSSPPSPIPPSPPPSPLPSPADTGVLADVGLRPRRREKNNNNNFVNYTLQA